MGVETLNPALGYGELYHAIVDHVPSSPDTLPLIGPANAPLRACPPGYAVDFSGSAPVCRVLPRHASVSPHAGTGGWGGEEPMQADDYVPLWARGVLGTTEALGLPAQIEAPPSVRDYSRWVLVGLGLIALAAVANAVPR